jgi:hypothetical protein
MSNNSIILGHFLPSSLLEQSTSIRRLTSTSSDSGDSGVDPVKSSSLFEIDFISFLHSHIDKNEKYLWVVFHHRLDPKNWRIFFNLMDK